MNVAQEARQGYHLLDQIPMGILVLRNDFTVLFWNRCLAAWTGIAKEDICGRDIRELFPHLAKPMFSGRLETLFIGGPPAVFSSQLHKYIIPASLPDGQMRAQHATVTAVADEEGDGFHALFVVQDVTDMNRRIREYRVMRDEAQREVARREQAEHALRAAHHKLERRVQERTVELVKAHAETELLLASILSIMICLDAESRIIQWNAAAERTFGLSGNDVLGGLFAECGIQWNWAEVTRQIDLCRTSRTEIQFPDVHCTRADGSEGILVLTANPIITPSGEPAGVLLLGDDQTENRLLETQLNQAQKLEAMGQLAAGIAHEINTPTQYVGDNARFLAESFADLQAVLEQCGPVLAAAERGPVAAEQVDALRAAFEKADLPYLMTEIPTAIQQSLEGIERVTRIVRSMKEFSHPGADDKTAFDLNKAIESTVTLCRNEWKYLAEMELNLQADLPLISCLPGDINQVILNLVINAAHAIKEVAGEETGHKGVITIRSRQDGDHVEIRIGDTGCGIPDNIRQKVFDLFFTTKDIGQGTGQGLAIARAVVVEKHGGTIDFETEVGKGTTFIIRLPIQPSPTKLLEPTTETVSAE